MTERGEPKYLLEIVSDTICPWCYIGKKHIDGALNLIDNELDLEVRWRPFELNAGIPREGLDRKEYRSQKFGSWEKSLALDAQVKEAGSIVGLDFHHERMTMTPNTLSSHVVLRLAQEIGRQDAVVEAIFKAYFTDGLDVGDPAVLTTIAIDCGLDQNKVVAALDDGALRDKARLEALAFSQAGVRGVPAVLLNRHLLFTGAQSSGHIAKVLKRATANQNIIDNSLKVLVDG